MKLLFDPNPSSKYPHGYWYVITDDGEYDADGVDPLAAVSRLVVSMEAERA